MEKKPLNIQIPEREIFKERVNLKRKKQSIAKKL